MLGQETKYAIDFTQLSQDHLSQRHWTAYNWQCGSVLGTLFLLLFGWAGEVAAEDPSGFESQA